MNTDFRLSFTYTLSLLAYVTQKVTAEHVLPVFIGSWYNDYNGFSSGLDSCGVTIHNPGELFSSPEEVFEDAFSHISGCVYDDNCYSHTNYVDDMPSEFISCNTDDWEKIILNQTSIKMEYCNRYCYGDSDSESGYYTVWISPLYDCPPNTRLSYDNITMEIGCTTTPTPCLADVVGRDLGSADGEFFGHVGLVASFGKANPNILEVLNGTNADPTKIGIFLDPLYGENSFFTQTKYWGSRYEPQDFARLSLSLTSQVIQVGVDQQQYPLNYTLSTFYYPGGTQEHPDNCQFRCDSFVYYCYDAGAQIKLQPVLDPLFTVPWTIFNDFMCSADPVEYCSAYEVTRELALLPINEIGGYNVKPALNAMQRTMTASLKIFQSLRPALSTKPAQKNQLLRLIEQYQGHQNSNISELFVRCLCFELEKMNPSQLDHNIRPLLSNLLWQHKYLSNDNFLLALMENTLSFYLENPHCDWLSAFFTVKAETQVDKEAGMIAYVDQQDNVTEKANLVTASKFSSLFTLTDEKRRNYGSLFQQTYHADNSLSDRAKKLILLSLSEMKTPVMEAISSTQFFQKANTENRTNFRIKLSP
ncbi:MAG: hypothetical protein V4496_04775 [Pseudomonadota bacterium]